MIKLDSIATFVANNALVPFPNHPNLRAGAAAPASLMPAPEQNAMFPVL
jgi:hypothetical protein